MNLELKNDHFWIDWSCFSNGPKREKLLAVHKQLLMEILNGTTYVPATVPYNFFKPHPQPRVFK